MPKKKETFILEQHKAYARDVLEALKLLERHQEEVWVTYGVNSRQARALDKTILLLRQEIPLAMEDGTYPKIYEDDNSLSYWQ